MLKIGEFSKLSLTTVKALRFYEKEGLLIPAAIDEWNGYRFYETEQLETAAKIKSYRQLGLSIDEIRSIFSGEDAAVILAERARALKKLQHETELRLSIINFLLEDRKMKYQVIEKEVPEKIVYTTEAVLESHADIMQWIPSIGEECMRLNPGLECDDPPYEFCEYPDGEYKEINVRIRHNEAVTGVDENSELVKFHIKKLPATRVLSVYHKGAYDNIGEAYAFIMAYAEKNGYEVTGPARESYIDGIWNKESVDEWLTEVQLPIK